MHGINRYEYRGIANCRGGHRSDGGLGVAVVMNVRVIEHYLPATA
jgi:hypothetical protein